MNLKIYDETAVRNLQINKKAAELFEDGYLSPPQYEQVKTDFPVVLNQPNLFVRLGLFFFTSLCISFSIAFIAFLLSNASFGEKGFGVLLLIIGSVLTVLNSNFIRNRHWYRQGSDNALCYASITCFVSGVYLIGQFQIFSIILLLTFVVLTFATYRYGDPILAFSAFYALLLTFLSSIEESQTPHIVLPFIGITLSLTLYYFSKRALKDDALFYWEDSLKVLEITGLVAFYGSINYYVVDRILLFNNDETGVPSPYNMLFATLTAIIPLVYLVLGIKNKDRILWILGSLGIVFSILTYRYYYAIMPIEWALTLAGGGVLVLAIFLIKYFKTPQNGFAYLLKTSKTNFIESVVMNQILHQAVHSTTSENTVKYGGGDFDGGGAGSEY
jgi:hypothetical protein